MSGGVATAGVARAPRVINPPSHRPTIPTSRRPTDPATHRLADPPTHRPSGDVAVVLNRSIVDDSAVLSPIDSGDYSISCHGTFSSEFCSLWSNNETACKEFWYCAYSTTGLDGEVGHEARGENGEAIEGGGGGVEVGTCHRNEPLLSGRECSVLKYQDEEHDHSYRELGVPGALDHIFVPFADYYGPAIAPERLAVRTMTPT